MDVKISCLFLILILLRKFIFFILYTMSGLQFFFNIHNSFESGVFFPDDFQRFKMYTGTLFLYIFSKTLDQSSSYIFLIPTIDPIQ